MKNNGEQSVIFDENVISDITNDLVNADIELGNLSSKCSIIKEKLHFYNNDSLSNLSTTITKIIEVNVNLLNVLPSLATLYSNIMEDLEVTNPDVEITSDNDNLIQEPAAISPDVEFASITKPYDEDGYIGLNQTLYGNYKYKNSDISGAGCQMAAVGNAIHKFFRSSFTTDDEYFNALYSAAGGKVTGQGGTGAKSTESIKIIEELNKVTNQGVYIKYPTNSSGQQGFGNVVPITQDVLEKMSTNPEIKEGLIYFKSSSTTISQDKIASITEEISNSGLDYDIEVTRVWCASTYSGFSNTSGHYVAGVGINDITIYDSVPKNANDYAAIYNANHPKDRLIDASYIQTNYLTGDNGHIVTSIDSIEGSNMFFDFGAPETFVRIIRNDN